VIPAHSSSTCQLHRTNSPIEPRYSQVSNSGSHAFRTWIVATQAFPTFDIYLVYMDTPNFFHRVHTSRLNRSR